jgi:hypothetical protein
MGGNGMGIKAATPEERQIASRPPDLRQNERPGKGIPIRASPIPFLERFTPAWAAFRHAASCVSSRETRTKNRQPAGPGQSNLLSALGQNLPRSAREKGILTILSDFVRSTNELREPEIWKGEMPDGRLSVCRLAETFSASARFRRIGGNGPISKNRGNFRKTGNSHVGRRLFSAPRKADCAAVSADRHRLQGRRF